MEETTTPRKSEARDNYFNIVICKYSDKPEVDTTNKHIYKVNEPRGIPSARSV